MLCQQLDNYKNGFYILNDHSINLSLLEEFYGLWINFFLSPEKKLYEGDLAIPVGYFGLKKNNIISNHEDFYYFPNSTLCPSYLRDITDYFFIQFEELAKYFIKDNLRVLPFDFSNLLFVMRIILYKSVNLKNNKILNPPHIDKSYFTLLPLASNTGLQYVVGKRWKSLEYSSHELLILFGEKLSQYIVPLEHRVVENTNNNNYRIAAAFFVS